METVKSLDEFKELIASYKKNVQKSISNIPLSKQVFEESICNHGCYYESEGCLLIYVDQGNYYNMFYIVPEDSDKINVSKKEKEIIINDVFVLKDGMAVSDGYKDLYLNSSFNIESINHQVVIDLKEHEKEENIKIDEANEFISVNHYRVELFKPPFPEGVFELWEEALKESDIPLEHRYSGVVLCLFDQDDEMIGTCWYRNRNKTSEWRHFVVNEKFRNKGIGKAMIYKWMELALKDNMEKGMSWIEDKNNRSLRFHERVGFYENSKINIQYILPRID